MEAERSIEERVADVLDAWLADRERGGVPDVESVCRAHPHLQPDLREALELLATVERRLGGDPYDEPLPERIGPFRIEGVLGRGASGVVYRAHRDDPPHPVALKVLAPSVSHDPAALARFRREARAAGRTGDPRIVQVLETGQDAGQHWIAMELVDGRPLRAWLAAQRRARREGRELPVPGPASDRVSWAVQVAIDVAQALEAAHAEGVLHRDIKPGNVLVDDRGRAHVVDFGLARVADETTTLTEPGALIGTIRYMSPEQAGGRPEAIDERSDVYMLGATLYEMLALEPPFGEGDAGVVLGRVVRDEPRSPRRTDPLLPRALENVVLRAMAKDPARRYPSAAALGDDLRRFAEGEAVCASRPGSLRRAADWARRRPLLATECAVGTIVAAMLLILAPRGPHGLLPAALEIARGAAGIPAVAEERAACTVVLADGRAGRVFAFRSGVGGEARVDLACFGTDRQPVWSARTDWRDYMDTLGRPDTRFDSMEPLVLAAGRGGLVVGTRGPHGYDLRIVDAATGRCRGGWTIPGSPVRSSERRTAVVALPVAGTGPRPLAVLHRAECARHPGPVYAVTVLDPAGSPVQRICLPPIEAPGNPQTHENALRTCWDAAPPTVTAITDHGVHVRFPVVEGRLDCSGARLLLGDRARNNFRNARDPDALAYDELLANAGGEEAYVGSLRAWCHEEPPR